MDIHAPASDNIDELRRVADANGVATGFWDWYGNWVGVSASTLLKVLGALGLPLDESSTVGDVHEALRLTEEREWRRTDDRRPPGWRLHVPSARAGRLVGERSVGAGGRP